MTHNDDQVCFADEQNKRENSKKKLKQKEFLLNPKPEDFDFRTGPKHHNAWDGTKDYVYPETAHPHISDMTFHEQRNLIKIYTVNALFSKRKFFKEK